jgi:hypothetical protein
MKLAYINNIDGKIDDDIFNSLIADYKQDERKIVRELERRMDADHGYLDEGIRLIGVAKDVRRMFQKADGEGRKRILTLLSNCAYADGTVSATYRKPFNIIVESLPAEGGFRREGAQIQEMAP